MDIQKLEGYKKFGAAVIASILAQGVADHGKEAAKINVSHSREILRSAEPLLATLEETVDVP